MQYAIFHRLLLLFVFAHAEVALTKDIDEVTVYADFSSNNVFDLSNSISVITDAIIEKRNASHLQQVLSLVPNVNFSSGASRGRFFQIRGVGERSQFVDPVNPSVGLVIDGIDFTGLGLGANTLDIDQIEVFRGPQGTLFGANALAGLISLKSNAPSDKTGSTVTLSAGEFDSYRADFVTTGAINQSLNYRVAGRSLNSDQFIDNDFLNKDNTNNLDEEFVKTAFAYDNDNGTHIDANLYYLNFDNGYDAFSLNNNRRTTSDQPGQDTLEAWAGGVLFNLTTTTNFDLQVQLSGLNSNSNYSFDEDWSFVGEFDPALFPYSSADSYERDRDNASIDVRLTSKPEHTMQTVFGAYYRSEIEDLERVRFEDLAIEAGFDPAFTSKYKSENAALYQQTSLPLTDQLNLLMGARVEYRDAQFSNNLSVSESTYESNIGGRISLEYRNSNNILIYALISHGYKSGGVNGQAISSSILGNNANLGEDTFTFDTETLTNYEIGAKGSALNNTLTFSSTIFYQDRNDAQFKQSVFDPAAFIFDDFLTNANANSIGAEIEVSYFPTANLDLYANLGVLDAEFVDFESTSHVDARDDSLETFLGFVDLDGRDVAHAPNYQFALGGEFRFLNGWYISIDIDGKDEFFFSNSHNEKSKSYKQFHANLGFRSTNWEAFVWGKNLTDKDIEERGFFFSNQFGNNPGNGYAPEVYTQLGEPQIFGVTAKVNFR